MLTIIPTRDGQLLHRDEEGNYWRTYVFIENARTYDAVETTAQAFQAAKEFGQFQKLLADLPAPRLFDTIPDFHNTPKRFAAFEQAIAADAANRAASVQGGNRIRAEPQADGFGAARSATRKEKFPSGRRTTTRSSTT